MTIHSRTGTESNRRRTDYKVQSHTANLNSARLHSSIHRVEAAKEDEVVVTTPGRHSGPPGGHYATGSGTYVASTRIVQLTTHMAAIAISTGRLYRAHLSETSSRLQAGPVDEEHSVHKGIGPAIILHHEQLIRQCPEHGPVTRKSTCKST